MLQILAEAGVPMRRQPLTEDQIDEAARLYEEAGLSLSQVCAELGREAEQLAAGVHQARHGAAAADGWTASWIVDEVTALSSPRYSRLGGLAGGDVGKAILDDGLASRAWDRSSDGRWIEHRC